MKSIAARKKARRFTLQALYQMQLTGDSASVVEQQFLCDHDMKRVDTTYFHELLQGIAAQEDTLLETIKPTLDRDLKEIDPVEKAILLIGGFELMERIDVPYKVVINEAVELAKLFGASESFKYVNSILDQLAKQYRQVDQRLPDPPDQV
ncbi:MAG: transcription antitermination factor NusB [Gammaproteobacteria bacterium]|nr:transcription antitermination factor NusB [Gammaproteobacteria bacterium]